MGNAASKSGRQLSRTLPKAAENVTKKVNREFLEVKKESPPKEDKKEPPKIYTERPKEDRFDEASKSEFLQKAVDLGIVDIKEVEKGPKFNENDESVTVLRNRQKLEKEYDGLMNGEEENQHYNIPRRFLTQEQVEKMNKPAKKGRNVAGLIDGRELGKLIETYRVEGEKKFEELAKKRDSKEENIGILAEFIKEGLVSLPSHKVTLATKRDAEGQVTKERFVVVKDEWVKEEKEKADTEKNKSPDEILDQFKKLEDLIKEDGKSQRRKKGVKEEKRVL